MKIITANGELELPKDFSMKIEKTNPILSENGDASVPATLPASSHNMEVLGHCERIDKADRYFNKLDAILSVGPVTKRGHLVIDTIQPRNGIDAVFAMDNSDLYVQSKEKSLKEIFGSANNGEGYSVRLGNSLNSAMMALQAVYDGVVQNADYMIFPVYVSPYVNGDKTYYQLNNEISNTGYLVYGQREVREGDESVTVPTGYGISPFLRLHRILDILFSILGYTVTYNCFSSADYKDLVLVNNCSDILCKDLINLYYADMVPSCTLSEFLVWLNDKFHVQAFINSESKKVKIVKMEDILGGLEDIDLTGIMEKDMEVRLNPARRVVLVPKVTIDGTEPADEDIDELLARYGGYYVAVSELEFAALMTGTPSNDRAYDCLILRRTTGEFYALYRDLQRSYRPTPVYVGTNIIKYDRKNTEETEEFSVSDVIPKLFTNGANVIPYIGERQHAHTSYNTEEKSVQEIIVMRGVVNTSMPVGTGYKTIGTTQDYYPNQDAFSISIPFGLVPHQMYATFWQRYNNIILNNAVNVRGRLRLDEDKFLNYDMSVLKLCRNQKLLPVSASANIGAKMETVDAEFILAKSFTDGIQDSAVEPVAQCPFKWQLTTDIETAEDYYKRVIAYDYVENNVHYWSEFVENGSSATLIDSVGNYWMGVPAAAGMQKIITRKVRYVIPFLAYAGGSETYRVQTDEVAEEVIFTSVTNS